MLANDFVGDKVRAHDEVFVLTKVCESVDCFGYYGTAVLDRDQSFFVDFSVGFFSDPNSYSRILSSISGGIEEVCKKSDIPGKSVGLVPDMGLDETVKSVSRVEFHYNKVMKQHICEIWVPIDDHEYARVAYHGSGDSIEKALSDAKSKMNEEVRNG